MEIADTKTSPINFPIFMKLSPTNRNINPCFRNTYSILNNKTFYIVVAEKSTVFNYALPLFNNLSSELIPSFGFGPHIFNFP